MRYGVFGDIHGNLPALDAVLEALGRMDTQRLLCVGDVVGYGAEPQACVDRLRELDVPVVAGNHDWAVAGRLALEYFNVHALAAVEWTREVLTEASVQWLADLKLDWADPDHGVSMAHATLHEPGEFDYLQTPYDAYLSFQALETAIGFVGHSHVPVAFLDGVPITYSIEDQIDLDGRRCIANPGSVGQPRDNDPRAAFMVYDTATRRLETHRVPYDVEVAASRILEAGLPAILAERLRIGR